MKSYQAIRKCERQWQTLTWLVLLAGLACIPALPRAQAATNVVLWDTFSRRADPPNGDDRAGWKIVPGNLFTFEANPPKAASDPGYYGRDYAFTGDAVVENRLLTAVFWSAQGRVVIYAKANAASTGDAASQKVPGTKIVEFVPLQMKSRTTTISRCTVLRNAGDEVALEVSFSAPGSADMSAVFFFGKTEIVEIKPAESMKGISLLSPIAYGVVPSFIGDDLIFRPADYPSSKTLSIPSENLFLGLLQGENNELVMTWPKGKQQVTLRLNHAQPERPSIESIDFENDGQSLCLAAVVAPGIWHKEALTPSFLEKDVTIPWKRPFAAKWKTQLEEAGVKTSFAFKEAKAEIWRGVPGSYNYPVWMSGEDAVYHLSKKVPPKGESLVYFLEGQDTPPSVSTPVDILKATLGRPMSSAILDVPGRKLRTHHRRGGDGVHRACTCGCTEAIQAFFEAGKEVEMKEDIAGDLDDMIYFVQRHLERIDEYRRFADDLIAFLGSKTNSSPELKPFLESLDQLAQRIPQEYGVQQENMKSLQHARELARQTLSLASKKDPNNLKAYMELLKAWRAMGGAQDYVLAQCHTITRKLYQEAGYGCVDLPKAVELAEEIRRRCRQTLRNPDGYEIWADYCIMGISLASGIVHWAQELTRVGRARRSARAVPRLGDLQAARAERRALPHWFLAMPAKGTRVFHRAQTLLLAGLLALLTACGQKQASDTPTPTNAGPAGSSVPAKETAGRESAGVESKSELIQITGGKFIMGTKEEIDAPPHEVVVASFSIDKHLVTQQQFQKVMGSNPSRWKGDKNPAEQLRWSDAVRFCNKRSELEGLKPCYDLTTWKCDFDANGYRLPTEAEWEYACRAGTTTAYFFGDNPAKLGDYAWYDKNAGGRPRPVGQKQPNPWGLHDICGNVWEWCNDFYQVDYYQHSPRENPRGPETGQTKVVRGGAWRFSAESCRAGYRYNESPGYADVCFGYDIYGFRCVRAATGSK